MKIFSEYLVESMTIEDWQKLLYSHPTAEQLPPESELKHILVQAPLFGSIVIAGYYINQGISLSKEIWLLGTKHNKMLANYIPEDLLTSEFIKELIKTKPNILDIFFARGIKIPDDIIEFAIKKLPANITQIKNPSEELKLAAISKRGELIRGFQNPSKELLNVALTEPKFIKNEKAYTKYVKQYFKSNVLLMNKWLRYASNIREQI